MKEGMDILTKVTIQKELSLDFIVKSLIIVILWSTPPLVSKVFVATTESFPGLYFGFLRYILGSLTLFIILAIQGNLSKLVEVFSTSYLHLLFSASWLVLMIIGQNFSVFFILGASSSILLNFNPVLIYLIAPFLFSEEGYSVQKSLGVLISTVGITFVFFAATDLVITNIELFLLGNFLGFMSGIAWAGYSLTIKKLFNEESSVEVTSLNLLLAAMILFLISLLFEKLPPLENYTLESTTGLVIIGVGAAAIAFTLYLQLVQKYGAVKAANIQFLIPLFSLFFAWVFLGEFSLLALIGGILCAVGVAIVTIRKSEKINF
jgi:drug/metabolite transporter (DMT)-like permease